jgi:mRNA interferase RelE/StbE
MIDFAYRIQWSPRAQKDLDRLSRKDRDRVVQAMERFAVVGEGDVRKLRGTDPLEWRLRVGTYRVRFTRDETARMLVVLRVLPRDKAYRVREPMLDFGDETREPELQEIATDR